MSDRDRQMVETCAKFVMAAACMLRRLGYSRSATRRVIALAVSFEFRDEVAP